MKRIQTILILAIIGLATMSCEKAQNMVETDTVNTEIVTLESFAKALSSAVSQHSELRCFIKEEAMKEFDKDSDVFYPFIKDKLISNGKSFRDYILEFIPAAELIKIEKTHPLLNILVPDWEWLDAFSINKWNTEDDNILVGYASPSDSHPVFQNGKLFTTLDSGMFPENPILIIKDNERMKLLPAATKSGEAQYAFLDDEFNPALDTKVSAITDYYYLNTDPGSEWYDAAEIALNYPEAVAAWEEYGNDPYETQRNLIYYGMKKGETSGRPNTKVTESIIAIKLNKMEVMEKNDEDSRLKDREFKTAIDPTDTTALIKAVWNDGKLEFKIFATTVKDDGSTQKLAEKAISIHASRLFNISKIKRNYYHGTWVTKHKYVYIGKYADLSPKWCKLTEDEKIKLNHWAPEKSSTIVDVHVYEMDGTKEEIVTKKINKQNGISLGIPVGDYINFSIDLDAPTEEVETTYKITHGSDDLYSVSINYGDYIIKNYVNNKYRLKTYSTGQFEFIVIPESD